MILSQESKGQCRFLNPDDEDGTIKRNRAGAYFKTMSFTFPFPCTSNPFERDTYVSSPHDRGFSEVPSPCIITKYFEEISIFNPDLRCCGKQNIFSKYLEGTVSSHKQAKNPACCCMNPPCRSVTHFHGMLVSVFNNKGQNLKENAGNSKLHEPKRYVLRRIYTYQKVFWHLEKKYLLEGNNPSTSTMTCFNYPSKSVTQLKINQQVRFFDLAREKLFSMRTFDFKASF